DDEEEAHRRPQPAGQADAGAALQLILVPPETELVETAAHDARLPGFGLEPDGIGVAPRRVVDAGEETPELPRRQGAAPVDLTSVFLSLLPRAKARSKIGPHPFLGFELEPDASVGAGLPGEETPDIAPAVPFVVERRLGKPAGPD